MPIAWRNIFSPPFSRSDRPFPRLVRHFLVRLVRSEQDAASSEVQLGVGALLGILAMPGAMTTFILLDKYSTFLAWLRGRLHQDVFVTFQGNAVLFSSFQTALPLVEGGTYTYFYGVGLK